MFANFYRHDENRMYREFQDIQSRKDKLQLRDKWADFKKRRVETINRYIEMRK